MAKINDLAGNFLIQTFRAPSLSLVVVDGITPKVTDLSVPTGNKLVGDNLTFVATITHPATVNVGLGTPGIILNINGVEKNALYASGSGTTSLTFTYTVEAGLLAPGGTITANPVIQMRGGSIKAASGNNLVPQLRISNVDYDGTVSASVDSLLPVITGIGCKPSIYATGQVISFKVRTNKNITVTGTPHLGMSINGITTKYASYISGSGTKELLFQYTVESDDSCSFNEFLLISFDLNSGTMNDVNGDPLYLTYFWPNVQYYALNQTPTDVVPPEITDITMPADGTYAGKNSGQYMGYYPISAAPMTVTFNKPVKPHSHMWMGGWRVQPVVNGIQSASSSTLNIKKMGSYGIIPAGTRFSLNGGAATIYTVTADAMVSNHTATLYITPVLSEQANDNQRLNDEFDSGFGLTPFVTVSASTGASTLHIDGLCYDRYISPIYPAGFGIIQGDQFTVNNYTYTVNSDYTPTNGAATIGFTPPLQNDVAVGFPIINAHSGRYWVDEYGNPPPFGMALNGNPQNGLQYVPVSGMGTDIWIFEPVLTQTVNNTTLTSFKTNQASGTWNIIKPAYNVTYGSLYFVDFQGNILNTANSHIPSLPTVTGISFTTQSTLLLSITPPTAKNYISGEEFDITIVFDGNVTVTASTYIQIELGVIYDEWGNVVTPGTPYKLYYKSGSGTTNLVFGITVGSNWDAPNGRIGFYLDPISSQISNGGNFVGVNYSIVNFYLPYPPGTPSIADISFNNITDVSIPRIVSANNILPTIRNYVTDEDIRFAVAFTENIYVTGQPYLELTLNGVTTIAPYEKTLDRLIYFKYRIKPTDVVAAGKLSILTDIILNGGTILDSGANAPTALQYNLMVDAGISFNAALDTTATIPVTFTISQYGTPKTAFVLWDTFTVSVNFNKTVVVDTTGGIPYLNLNVNGTPIQVPFDPSLSTTISPVFYFSVGSEIGEKGQVTITSPIELNGGTIKDYTSTNNAILTFTPPDTSQISFNSIVPLSLTSLTVTPSTGVAHTGEKLMFRTTFSELVQIQGGGGLG